MQYGKLNSDGSIAEWPDSDFYGNPYQRPPAAIHTYAEAGKFVVLPARGATAEALAEADPGKAKRSRSRFDESQDDES